MHDSLDPCLETHHNSIAKTIEI